MSLETVTQPTTPKSADAVGVQPKTAAPSRESSSTKISPLRLSEAIRIGSMVTEQAFGSFGNQEKTCGIGAAQVAFGETPSGHGPLAILLTERLSIPCPDCVYTPVSVGSYIIHLNDDHQWPRQKIADSLEEYGL